MPHALVTGASRGIGRAVVVALRDAGYTVTGTSRVPEAVSDPPPGIRFIALDLGDPRSIDLCAAAAGPVDLLVNNAGYSLAGPLCETPLAEIETLTAVNWVGVLRLTRAVIPAMPPGSRILNIGSLAARIPLPFVSVYAGTKAAIEAFTHALRPELAPLGIAVSVIEPGFVQTDIRQETFAATSSFHAARIAAVRDFRSRAMARGLTPEAVAKVVLHAALVRDPPAVWIVGGRARLFNALRSLLPATLFERAYRRKLGI